MPVAAWIPALRRSASATARLVLLSAFMTAAGCTRVTPPALESAPAPPSTADARQRLESADAAVRRGCYDCLRDGLTRFEALLADPDVGSDARESAVRTALLLAIRESELGLRSGQYIERARTLLGPADTASPELAGLVDIAEVIASGPVGFTRSATSDRQLAAILTVARSQERWAHVLRNVMPQDLTASYLWLTLACGSYGYSFPDHDRRDEVMAPVADVPLILYKSSTACGLTASEPLEALLATDPAFREIDYYLGLFALGGQTRRLPDLDGADARLRAAYEWRQDWPTLTLAIGNVAMSAEDFPRAYDFYSRTLAMQPDDADALAGVIRALTYSNRHDEAIAAADRMLAIGRNPGEAYYWRAMNLARLKRDDDAWQDVERASQSLANADVPKLAGIIAINRRDFAVARARLELALGRRRTDCETAYYLQSVLSEQRDWEAAARTAADAGSCFENEETGIQEELATLRASLMAPERKARIVARREQQLASDARMRATAWYNAAAANFNLARADEARRFAEKVADDAFFGERARSLLERLK
jgi:tetratricopeptide (TPR) repeat protein